MLILSPITHTRNIRLIDTVDTEKIIDLYKSEIDINVGNAFENIDQILIYECLDTGYLFYYPFHIMGTEKLYDDLKIKMPEIYHSPYYPVWKWEYEVSMKFINDSDSVLEIGCGSGKFLNKLREKNCNRKLKGLELNQNTVDENFANGLDVEFKTIQTFSDKSRDQYDIVCSFQVLEHVWEVKSFLESSILPLKQNGKLIVGVPYNDPFLFKNDILNTLNLPPHHMGLWGKRAFKNIPNFFPLKLEKIIIESLPDSGYDFERFYLVNKDVIYKPSVPFKRLFDKFYYKYLKKNCSSYEGKNIIAVYSKI